MSRSIEAADRALRAWLELGPDRGRPEALDRALAATRRVSQRPGWTFPDRWIGGNRALAATTAALVVVIVAAAILLRPAPLVGPPASPTPTAPTQTPASTPMDGAVCSAPGELCWGDLEAGTYPTFFFNPRLDFSSDPEPVEGGVTFTVPGGWAEARDRITDFRLTRSGDPTSTVEGWIRPIGVATDAGCAATPDWASRGSAESLIAWLGNVYPAISNTPLKKMPIDGHDGQWIDISLLPNWTETCDGSSVPTIPIITEEVGPAGPIGDEPYVVSISGSTRMRVIVVDLTQSETGFNEPVLFLITAPDAAAFDSFVEDAMSIVESIRFQEPLQ